MKIIILLLLVLIGGCKAAGNSGDKSYFGKDHTPYQPLPALFLTTAAAISHNSVHLTWNHSQGSDNYHVYYKLATATEWLLVGTTKTPSFKVENLAANTAYDFVIIAKNSVGEVKSNLISMSTLNHTTTTTLLYATASSVDEGTQSIITLPYSIIDSALGTACEVTELTHVHLTRNCECDVSGVCSVGMTGYPQYSGPASFKYKVTSGSNSSSQAIMSFDINALNDRPTISSISSQQSLEDTPLLINFIVNDPDSTIECNAAYLSLTSTNNALVAPGSVVFGGTYPNCTALITPANDIYGVATLAITVSDGQDSSTSNPFLLTVLAVNDAPLISTVAPISTNEDAAKTVSFTISDVDSSLSCSGSVSASSNAASLIDSSGIIISGVAPHCTITLIPKAFQSGSALIDLSVSDGSLTTHTTFSYIVASVNNAPVLGFISDVTGSEDSALSVSFVVSDVDSALSCNASYLSAVSSNPSVLLSTDISFSGTYPNCIATFLPLRDANGITYITIAATDGSLVTTSNAFMLTFNAINDAPTISLIMPQSSAQDVAKIVNFTIGDVDSTLTCAGSITGTSSNNLIVADSGIVISGVYPNCSALITPVSGKSGVVDITLTVHDASTSVSTSFPFTLTSVNYAPVISTLSNTSVNEDAGGVLNFVITDPDSTLSCSSAFISMTSDNTSLINPGSIVIGGSYPNCQVSFVTAPDQSGSASIFVTVTDGIVSVNSNTITVTVVAVNDAPAMEPLMTQNLAVNQSTTVNLVISDVDSSLTCSGSLSLTTSNSAIVDPASVVFSGTAPNCVASITPLYNASGAVTLNFTVRDGALQATQSMVMTFDSAATPPVALNIAPVSFDEDTQSMITLSYTDSMNGMATSCYISSVTHVYVSTPCSCSSGICSVGLTGSSNYFGAASFNYTVTVNNYVSNQALASLNILAVNDAPTISTIQAQSAAEDTVKTINFTINDPDSTLTCAGSVSATSSDTTIVETASIVVSGTAPNCVAQITPVSNAYGTTSITLRVSDTQLISQSVFSMTFTPVNDSPTMSTIATQNMLEDESKVINFTINDPDSIITCSGSMQAASSNTSLISSSEVVFGGSYPNCTATITPKANNSGSADLTFTLSDGVASSGQTFTVNVAGVNDAPVISTISAQVTDEDTVKTVNFSIHDVDNTLTCAGSVSADTSNPSLISSSGIVITGSVPNCVATLTPNADKSGVAIITLTVSDTVLSAQSVFSFTVNAQNDAPIIAFIPNATALEDQTSDIHFTVTDPDSTIVCSSAYISATSSNVLLVPETNISISGSYPNCVARVTPVANQFGSTNIVLSVTDGVVISSSNIFTLTFTAVNDAPVLSLVPAQVTNEDTPKTINFTLSDIDSIVSCSGNVIGTSSDHSLVQDSGIVISGTAPNCQVQVSPVANKSGNTTITLTANDGADSVTSTFSFTVNAVNDAPTIASILPQSVNEDSSVIVNFVIDDIDSTMTCSGRVTAVSGNTTIVPTSAIVIGGSYPNCTASITPAPNQNGLVSITFTVTDGSLFASTVMDLNVIPVDDAPVASNLVSVTLNEDVQSIVNLPYTDVDLDHATSCAVSNLSQLTVTTACSCSAGVCSVGVTGTANYFGTAGFSFTVSSNGLTSNTATAAVMINPVNDAPVIGAISAKTIQERSTSTFSFTISDVDSTLTCAGSVSAASSNTALIQSSGIAITGSAPNCTATLTPRLNAHGTSVVTFTVSDGSLSAARSFNFNVESILDVTGNLISKGVADTNAARTISFAGITLDESVSKVEICISEDTNLNGSISAGEKCNTQTWLDITTKINASGSTTTGWLPYTLKNGVDGASFITNLGASCSTQRNYFTEIRLTTQLYNVTTEITTSAWSFWSPRCLGSSIGLWLDASDETTLYSNTGCTTPAVSGVNGGVLCWRDKSANNILLNNTETNNPRYEASVWSGGRPAVVFSGANDLYKLGVDLTPKNIISAVKVNANVVNSGLIGLLYTDWGIRMNGTGNWISNEWGSDFTYSGGVSFVNGASGTSHGMQEHVLYQTKGSNLTPLLGVAANISVGGYLGSGLKRINANVGEIIMCTTDCSSSQTKLEGYLAHKWGTSLPANHPYKNTPP